MVLVRLFVAIGVFVGWMSLAFAPKTSTTGPPDLDHSDLHPRSLDASLLNDSNSFAVPTRLQLVGGRLLVIDRTADRMVHVLDPVSGAYIGSVGPHGEGPGEVKAARSAVPDTGDPAAFWVFDAGLARLTLIDAPKLTSMRPADYETRQLRLHAHASDMVRLPSGDLIAAGMFPDGRLVVIGPRGEVIGLVGQLPASDVEVPRRVLQHAYTGNLAPHPDGTRLAFACRLASRLEIHPIDGSPHLLAQTPFDFDPVFSIREAEHGPVMATGDGLRFGYLDVATTEGLIFALFSGRTRAGFPGRAYLGEYVHLFDWQGRFRGAFRLDNEVISIAVDERANTLYAIRHSPEPSIISYRLEGWTGRPAAET